MFINGIEIKPVSDYLRELQFRNIYEENKNIIIKDLISLTQQKTRLHLKTISFIYKWLSFGGEDPKFEQEIWDEVCISQNPEFDLYRATNKLHPGTYTSWTKSIDVAKKICGEQRKNTKIYEYKSQNGIVRYYPLCDVANNIDISDGTCMALDEYLNKAKFEQEYIVLEHSSTIFALHHE